MTQHTDPLAAGPDIICLGSIPWHSLRQRPQQLMTALARHRRVLYVETATWLLPALVHRAPRRDLRSRPPALHRLGPNLAVFRPLGLGLTRLSRRMGRRPSAPRLRRWDQKWIWAQIALLAALRGLHRPLLWAYFHEDLDPTTLPSRPLVFDSVDDIALFAPTDEVARRLRLLETDLIHRARCVLVTSRALLERARRLNPNTHLVPNAADLSHFSRTHSRPLPPPPPLAGMRPPIVGYIGALSYWLDIPLLRAVCDLLPDFSFALVGPVLDRAALAPLAECPNVRLLGERTYDELPDYLCHFSVCIAPFALDSMTKAVSPIKVFEYLAADRPVVATPLPELEPYRDVVRLASTPHDFAAALRDAAAEPPSLCSRQRREIAAENTWDCRAEQVLRLIGDGRLD